jgi:hypothetical protein
VPGQLPRGVASFRLELAPEGAVHEATRFYDDAARNQNAWNQLPHYYWSAATERLAPGASVLVWNPIQGRYGKQPLIAHHYAGAGKVMFVGTDATWRWRQNVGDRFFYKFWGQSIRFVSRRDPKKAKTSWIEVRPVRAQPGEQAEVELMAFGKDGTPRAEPELTLAVRPPDGADPKQVPAELSLTADPGIKGRYLGKFTPPAEGEYVLTYQPGGQEKPVEARLRVAASGKELQRPYVDRDALAALASDGKGQRLELSELASIKDQLKRKTQSVKLDREADVWDNWLVLVLLIFVYSLDVGLRRLVGLS